jgi:hypothetical protein
VTRTAPLRTRSAVRYNAIAGIMAACRIPLTDMYAAVSALLDQQSRNADPPSFKTFPSTRRWSSLFVKLHSPVLMILVQAVTITFITSMQDS